jgi:CDP-glucose 4,6-dehydratase
VIRCNGISARDFFYIEDGIRAHLLVAEKMESSHIAGEAFHFNYERPQSVIAVVDKITKLMNSDVSPIIQNQTSYAPAIQYLCAQKARDVLGWKPVYDFESGLIKTIDWYQKYFEDHVG